MLDFMLNYRGMLKLSYLQEDIKSYLLFPKSFIFLEILHTNKKYHSIEIGCFSDVKTVSI